MSVMTYDCYVSEGSVLTRGHSPEVAGGVGNVANLETMPMALGSGVVGTLGKAC